MGPSDVAALFHLTIDAMSHHSEHEMAQKFIQLSGVIAVMSKPRQDWGKIMAVRSKRLFNNENRGAPGGTGEHRDMRQRQ